MIFTLTGHQVQAAAALYEPMDIHLAVESLLSGISPGRIFVDNPVSPSVAWANIGKRHYLVGSPNVQPFNEALSLDLEEVIIPSAAEGGQQALSVIYTPAISKDQIDGIISEREAVHTLRHQYTMRLDDLTREVKLPPGYEMAIVDGQLLRKRHLGNIDRLMEEVHSEASSIDHFLRHCFGVCVLKDDEIVGWCLSEYNVNQRCEVGIETLEDHRNLGIATAMTTALIEEAGLRGYSQVGWHCYENNRASIATALKVGFQKSHEYPASYFHFN
jgi:GNAT superfamily N-acetyltransferase